ncbi:MAG: hypothetical protein J2P36_21810, partial [Ktedonobacteraceae bacterium]|nr:hypothetical protein [Ktedonobacteraceae bacterium]
VEAHFASYELPPHMHPHVGTAMATMGVRPHQCRLVSESTVLKQRQMTVTSVIASPSYRGMGPFLPPPRMRHVSCKAPSLALTSSSQGTICFQGPGTLSVTIKDVISLATDRPALVGCDRFSDGTYEGMGVEVEAKDGSRVQVADLLPGFQPTITICHITQWSTA